MEMYFRYCHACNCYEYDCHGIKDCIALEEGYNPAHVRDRLRREAQADLDTKKEST